MQFPVWGYYMIGACIAAFIVGWVAGYIVDEYRNRW
jgi:uncharacterized membrane protein YraQ (UPF0718 family)